MSNVNQRLGVAILGSGNIGTDLTYKLHRDDRFDLKLVAGIDRNSDGLARARELGCAASSDGIDAILEEREVEVVFDATSAKAHAVHAKKLAQARKRAIDLTPAKVGLSVVPSVNMARCRELNNVNLISCAAQATVPIVHAVNRITPVEYAEIVSTVSSNSIGPGTRQNIEEFTHTTQRALEEVGGAARGKALVVVNPADPPIIMRNTVYTVIRDETQDEAVESSIRAMAEQVQSYVPGYQLTVEPFRRKDHFMIGVEVTGAGDYLPTYAGNLDIINAAAVAVGAELAEHGKGAYL